MINSKGLMVDNYLQDAAGHIWQLGTVGNIANVTSHDGQTIGNVDIEELQPIPITPDLLEKAGFQWTTKGLAYHTSVDAIRLLNRPEGWAVCTRQGHVFAYVKHLHTLQNLCHAINGTDLVVNL